MNLTKNGFEKLVNERYDFVKRHTLDKNVSWDRENLLSNGFRFQNDVPKQQYVSLLNQDLKIGLGNIVGRLQGRQPLDDMLSGESYIPDIILADLVRYAELNREEGTVQMYVDSRTNEIFGTVSPQHTYIPSKIVYEQLLQFYDAMGVKYDMSFQDNYNNTRIDVVFPEMALEVGRNDNLNFKVVVMNGDFGNGALKYVGGFIRLICTNGMIIGEDIVSTRLVHKANDKVLLTKFLGSMVESFAIYDAYSGRIREAAEITEDWIDSKVGLVNFLPDNFNVLVREAKEIYSTVRQNNYKQNAFWIGQAVAEVARDKGLEDRYRLEQIAGQICLAQVH